MKAKENNTSFLEVMGDTPYNKVLDFLIENERESWTMGEISENSDIGYSTLKMIIPRMLNFGLIIIVRTVGKSNLYTINQESPIVKELKLLHHTISTVRMESLLNE